MLKEFARRVFADVPGVIEVREIPNGGRITKKWFKSLDEFANYEPPETRNVYVGMASRKSRLNGKKENCLRTRVLWADFDKVTVQEVEDILAESVMPRPSMILNSGHGVHVYWTLNKPAGIEVEPILKAMVKELGCDPLPAHFAAVMRVPGTLNVKYEPVVPCYLVNSNNDRYSLQEIADLLNVSRPEPLAVNGQLIPELESCKMACIKSMALGVSKGERNFALGKITAWLKQQGYNFNPALKVVERWNQNNTPPKDGKELRAEFRGFWNGDYKYLGCNFENERLNELQRRFCSGKMCKQREVRENHYTGEGVPLDNCLFKQTIYKNIKPLTMAMLSMVLLVYEDEKGITREQLARLLHSNTKSRGFIEAVDTLESMGFIEITKGIARHGTPDRIKPKRKSNYGRGYTIVNNLLSRLYISGNLPSSQYKLLILLESFAYGLKRDVFPSNETLAATMGMTERNIRILLDELEKDWFIRRTYSRSQNGATRRIIQLRYLYVQHKLESNDLNNN